MSLKGFGMALGLAIDVEKDEAEEQNIAVGTQVNNSRMLCDCSEVEPGFLWVGSLRATRAVDELSRRGVKHIVNLSRKPISSLAHSTFSVTSFDVYDSAAQQMFMVWEQIIEFLETKKKLDEGVLVCCHRGISRSVATCAAYLMKTNGTTWEATLRQLQAARPAAAPNFEFCRQLFVFERANCDATAAVKAYSEVSPEFGSAVELQRMSPLMMTGTLGSMEDDDEAESLSSAITSTTHGTSSSNSTCRSSGRRRLPLPQGLCSQTHSSEDEDLSVSSMSAVKSMDETSSRPDGRGSICVELEYAVRTTEVVGSPHSAASTTPTGVLNTPSHSSGPSLPPDVPTPTAASGKQQLPSLYISQKQQQHC